MAKAQPAGLPAETMERLGRIARGEPELIPGTLCTAEDMEHL
jgi:hypothetical protein